MLLILTYSSIERYRSIEATLTNTLVCKLLEESIRRCGFPLFSVNL